MCSLFQTIHRLLGSAVAHQAAPSAPVMGFEAASKLAREAKHQRRAN
jgi:hypothetical protein